MARGLAAASNRDDLRNLSETGQTTRRSCCSKSFPRDGRRVHVNAIYCADSESRGDTSFVPTSRARCNFSFSLSLSLTSFPATAPRTSNFPCSPLRRVFNLFPNTCDLHFRSCLLLPLVAPGLEFAVDLSSYSRPVLSACPSSLDLFTVTIASSYSFFNRSSHTANYSMASRLYGLS